MTQKETKREKFVRLVELRMNNVLKQIHLLGNLSSKNNYEYTQEDVKKMCSALKKAVDEMERKFSISEGSNTFHL